MNVIIWAIDCHCQVIKHVFATKTQMENGHPIMLIWHLSDGVELMDRIYLSTVKSIDCEVINEA